MAMTLYRARIRGGRRAKMAHGCCAGDPMVDETAQGRATRFSTRDFHPFTRCLDSRSLAIAIPDSPVSPGCGGHDGRDSERLVDWTEIRHACRGLALLLG